MQGISTTVVESISYIAITSTDFMVQEQPNVHVSLNIRKLLKRYSSCGFLLPHHQGVHLATQMLRVGDLSPLLTVGDL